MDVRESAINIDSQTDLYRSFPAMATGYIWVDQILYQKSFDLTEQIIVFVIDDIRTGDCMRSGGMILVICISRCSNGDIDHIRFSCLCLRVSRFNFYLLLFVDGIIALLMCQGRRCPVSALSPGCY
ncbi:hypothetical protein ES703_107116 [subsurface metagenome]